MRNLFQAEWEKTIGNRWVVGCMLWIFPIAGIAFFLFMSLVLPLSSAARASLLKDPPLWTDSMIGAWDIPNNPLGRLLLVGFAAVMFAGEYQWGTLKNIVPRNRRTALILIKFFTMGLLVVFTFALMSLVMLVGMGFLVRIVGGTYGPAVTGDVLADFAGDYALQATLAFTATLIAVGYAALAGMFSRSILGGVLFGFGATFVENLSVVGLVIIAYFLKWPDVLHLYRLTPSYNLANVSEWIRNNHSAGVELAYSSTGKVVLTDSLPFSMILLAVWVVGLIVLVVFLFRRQDITS